MKRKTLALVSVGVLLVVAVVLVPVQTAQATVTHSKPYDLTWTTPLPLLRRCVTLHVSGTLHVKTQARKSVTGVTYYRSSKTWVNDTATTLSATEMTGTHCSATPGRVDQAYFAQAWTSYSCSSPQDLTLTSQASCPNGGSPGQEQATEGTLAAQPSNGPGAEMTRYAGGVEYPLSHIAISLGKPARQCFSVGAWAMVSVANTSDGLSYSSASKNDKQVCLTP
jgi:hypothetical protein